MKVEKICLNTSVNNKNIKEILEFTLNSWYFKLFFKDS